MMNKGAAVAFVRKSPHLWLSASLFGGSLLSLHYSVPSLAGALFGAGASLLGAWVTELNSRRSAAEDKARREGDARRYLAPELNRIIERVLYIHRRAIPNFISASCGQPLPRDLREDFLPYMPVLYPTSPQFRDLSGDDAIALIAFYDSLHAIEKSVNDWWEREGQLPVNIFNMILTFANHSLELAMVCIERFEIEKYFPPKYESWGTLSSRISRSMTSASEAMARHLERNGAGTGS